MAIIRLSLCSALPLPLSHVSSTNKVPNKSRFFMCAKNGISVNPQIKLSDHGHKKNKIFEDRSAGIVCYRDENGEITCEGYDEGPRFHQQISLCSCSPSRDLEIIELLQRCWVQVGVESEFTSTADHKGVAGHRGF
ncbi:Unknown protein [Striga hermonthica]|uniref:Uncharacterized protein n=1 Tax=Striga hermonthica TaxID=68872 RepID=A0A9N7RH12_STRHE|nr:Unknown protein [Striga hermonthica]